MNRFPIVLLCALIAMAPVAVAQSSARFTLVRSVIAAGGTTFSGNTRFQLGSTIAQPIASMPGNIRFSIQDGYWIWSQPTIFAPSRVGNSFTFSFQSEAGLTYKVQFVDSFGALNWQSQPSILGDGTVQTITTTVPDQDQRFYRLIEQ